MAPVKGLEHTRLVEQLVEYQGLLGHIQGANGAVAGGFLTC